MAEYQLNEEGGVVLTAYNMSIPEDERNRHWREYQKWVADGNVPDPTPTRPAPSDDDRLNDSDQKMIRVVDWMLQYFVTSGAIPLADIPAPVKALYLERKAQRGA